MQSRAQRTMECRGYVAAGLLATLLVSPFTAHAASPEDDYLAARDRYIAALTKLENAKDPKPGDAQNEKATKDLEQKLKAVIGPFAVRGFPTKGKLNLESLFPHDQGFGMLDGIAYGAPEGARTVVVTTPTLLDKWLASRSADDLVLTKSASAAVKTELFYTWAVSADVAVVHYGALPIAAPGAKLAYATLSARTQDQSPGAPEEIFVVLEHKGRVFIVNEKLGVYMKPIASCAVMKFAYGKKADAAEAAYLAGGRKDTKLTDEAAKLREAGDAATRTCFGHRIQGTPAYKAATEQVAAVVAAFTR